MLLPSGAAASRQTSCRGLRHDPEHPEHNTDRKVNKQLSKYPILNNFERQTSVPKVYAFLGLVGIYFFLVFFNIAGEFLVNFAGFLVPGYYSLEALFTSNKSDDTQVRSPTPQI
jgi:hypothetical protein